MMLDARARPPHPQRPKRNGARTTSRGRTVLASVVSRRRRSGPPVRRSSRFTGRQRHPAGTPRPYGDAPRGIASGRPRSSRRLEKSEHLWPAARDAGAGSGTSDELAPRVGLPDESGRQITTEERALIAPEGSPGTLASAPGEGNPSTGERNPGVPDAANPSPWRESADLHAQLAEEATRGRAKIRRYLRRWTASTNSRGAPCRCGR